MLYIMRLVALASLVLFTTANPLIARQVSPDHGQCSETSCYKALEYAATHGEGNAKADCKSYQEATVTECPKTTTTTIDHCTSTVTVTNTHGSGSNTPRAVIENASPFYENSLQFLVKRSDQAQCPKLSKPSNIPAYAKHACGSSDYISACSCLGYPATTRTFSPTSTSTLRHCSTTTRTIYSSCTPVSTTVTHTGTTTVTVTSTTTVRKEHTETVFSTQSATATTSTIHTKTGYPVTVSTVTVSATESTITSTTTLDATVETTTSTHTTLTDTSTDIETASTPAMTTSTTYSLTIASASASVTVYDRKREVIADIAYTVDTVDTSICSTHTVSTSAVHTVTSTHHVTTYVSASTTTTVPTTTTVSTETHTSIYVTFPFTTTASTTIAPSTTGSFTETKTDTITDTITYDVSTATVDVTTTITTTTSTETALATETVMCENGEYCYPYEPGSDTGTLIIVQCGMQATTYALNSNTSAPTYQDCIIACSESDDCYVFSYQISTFSCVIYGDDAYNPVPNSDYISGYYDGPLGCQAYGS